MKICTKCKVENQVNLFPKTKAGNLGSWCKACVKIYKSKWHLNNKEQENLKATLWYKNNIERGREISREWKRLNKDRVRARSALYYKRNSLACKMSNAKYFTYRFNNDMNFRLCCMLRTRLRAALKNSHKSGSAVRQLGCSIEELKIYLESKFQPGMSWDNWSTNGWHIDHIVALSRFDLSDPDQVRKACHYTNLQPLWAKDNLRKSNKIF